MSTKKQRGESRLCAQNIDKYHVLGDIFSIASLPLYPQSRDLVGTQRKGDPVSCGRCLYSHLYCIQCFSNARSWLTSPTNPQQRGRRDPSATSQKEVISNYRPTSDDNDYQNTQNHNFYECSKKVIINANLNISVYQN